MLDHLVQVFLVCCNDSSNKSTDFDYYLYLWNIIANSVSTNGEYTKALNIFCLLYNLFNISFAKVVLLFFSVNSNNSHDKNLLLKGLFSFAFNKIRIHTCIYKKFSIAIASSFVLTFDT